MKKIFLIILASILFSELYAQNQYFGVLGGTNISNVSASEVFNESNSKVGFSGGVLYETELSKLYTFGAEVLFSENGFLDEIILTDEQGNVIQNDLMMSFSYNYISVPLTIGFRFGQKLFVVAKAGLQPSVLLEAKTFIPRIEANGQVLESETNFVTDRVSRFDIAGVMGIDVNYKLYNRFILFTSFGGKYSITKFSNKNYFDQFNMRHNGVTLSLGIKYNFLANP